MSIKNKVLILVQGINSGIYLKEAVKNSNLDLSVYDKVIQVKTEKLLDMSWVSKLPFIGDKHGDYVQYFLSKSRRKKLSRLVRQLITVLRIKYDVVDVIAHSLGSVIALTSKTSVNNFYSLGSPLSFKNSWLGAFVRYHTKKYLKLDVTNNFYYAYSPKDIVCSHYNKKVAKLLQDYKVEPIKSDSRHSADEYLDDIEDVFNRSASL